MQTSLQYREKSYLVENLKRNQPRLYLALVHHLTTGKQRLEFYNRPYLIPIYEDNSQDIVLMKSVQCGLTEWAIIETVVKCELGFSTFYVLPKYDLRNTFVANRIDKLFNMVPFYKARLKESVGDSDSKQIKHFWNGTIKFASSNTISDFSEFPADMVVIDELDRCDQSNIPYAADRIKASKHKLTRKIANPTITGFGISEEFKNSDQKEWMVKCDSCGKYNEIDFFKIVCHENADKFWTLYDTEWNSGSNRDINCHCCFCHSKFNRLSHEGYWHRKNPKSQVSGYHISRLMDSGTKVSELWNLWQIAQGNETKIQAFVNSDLGIPYESEGAKLSEHMLDKCIGDPTYKMLDMAKGCFMGVDVGAILHYSICKFENNKRKKVSIGTVPTFEELDRLMLLYGIETCVIDALPETHKTKEFRDRFRGRVWLCTFHSKEGSTKDAILKDDTKDVSVDRTQLMDESHSDILKRLVELPIEAKNLEGGDYYKQMTAPTRIFDQKMNRFVWREGSRQDHHRLADAYERLAVTLANKNGVKVWEL